MGRQRITLNRANPAQSLQIRSDDEAEYLIIRNDNPVPVYVRIGSPELPTELNYDIIIAPNFREGVNVTGREFGLRLGAVGGNPTLIVGATVVEAIFNEPPPVFGGVPIAGASLAVSDAAALQNYAGGAYYGGVLDLLLWGGFQVFVSPDVTSGQGLLQIEVSPDSSNPALWRIYGQWAIWPNVPAVLTIPRVARYARVLINVTAIAGEPNISGRFSLRTVLEEVQQTTFTPNSNSISKAYNVPALQPTGSLFVFCSIGLLSIGLRLQNTSGTAGQMIWRTGPTPTGPWALVAYREQLMNGLYGSIFRSVGNLDAFVQVEVQNLAVSGALIGTLSGTIQQTPDLTQYLQSIYHVLGDPQQPVQVNQNIYAELDAIRQQTDQLESLATAGNASLAQIDIDASTINTNIVAMHAALHADIVATTTAVNAGNVLLTTMSNRQNAPVIPGPVNVNYTVAGVYAPNAAIFVPGWFIVSCQISYQIKAAMPDDFFLQIAYGTPGAVSTAIYGGGGVEPEGVFAPYPFNGGPNASGILIPAGMTTLWVFCNVAPVFLALNFVYRT